MDEWTDFTGNETDSAHFPTEEEIDSKSITYHTETIEKETIFNELESKLKQLDLLLDKNELEEASPLAEEIAELSTVFEKEDRLSSSFHKDATNLASIVHEKSGTLTAEEKNRLRGRLRNLRDSIRSSKERGVSPTEFKQHLEQLKEKENAIEQERSQLQELEERLNRKENELKQVFKDVSEQKKIIEENLSRAQDLKNERSQLTQWEVGDSIGGQFKNRKEELNESLSFWLKGSLASIVVLLIFSMILYIDISGGNNQGTTVLSKVTLILPVSIMLWFFVTNYSRQKRLMREYEFKETMAGSFRGSLEIVREDMSEDEGPHVGEFVVDTMDRIYSNPQQNLSQPEESGDQNQNQGQTGPLSQGAVAQILNRLGKK